MLFDAGMDGYSLGSVRSSTSGPTSSCLGSDAGGPIASGARSVSTRGLVAWWFNLGTITLS
jgi:hypothetical protein